MPRNTGTRPIPNPFVNRTGEVPITAVRNCKTALFVDVQNISGINYSLKEFVNAAYKSVAPSYENETKSDFLQDMIAKNTLPLGLECIHFQVKVTGCTRIFTHQLVRQRIGITFSQQCSGEADWRHHDIIMPSCNLSKNNIDYAILGKHMYARALDNDGVSVQEARYLLPQCLETYIYFDASLLTLINLYKKRTCLMTQTWETHLFAERLKRGILAVLPELEPLFKNPCEEGKCWYNSVKESGNNIFLNPPDELHDNFDYHPYSFPYSVTSEEQAYCEVWKRDTFPFYIGKNEVTEKEYYEKVEEYKIWR